MQRIVPCFLGFVLLAVGCAPNGPAPVSQEVPSAADPGVSGRFQNDLPKMEEGGLDAAYFSVYHGQGNLTAEAYAAALERAMEKFDGIRRMTYDLYPDRIGLAYSAADVERIHGEGRLVALIGVENPYPIGEDLSLLEEFHRLGARYVSITHNGHNQFGDAAVAGGTRDAEAGTGEWGGLSPLGRALVAELNRLGIFVDVSHAAKSTMMEAVGLSRAPVIASHSSVRGVTAHPRNLDDEQLRAIRDNGGVAQIDERFPPASLEEFIDHLDHAVTVAGIDYVGISSDFGGGGGVVNHLRALRQVERVAVEMQAQGG